MGEDLPRNLVGKRHVTLACEAQTQAQIELHRRGQRSPQLLRLGSGGQGGAQLDLHIGR